METFNVPRYFSVIAGCAALLAEGRGSPGGVVLDIGEGATCILPVFEDYLMPHGIQRINLAGEDLAEYMSKILMQSKVSLTSPAEMEIARELVRGKVKDEEGNETDESFCRVAADYEAEKNPTLYGLDAETGLPADGSLAKTYTMPDGLKIPLQEQQVRCPELLFDPTMNGKTVPGLHHLVWNCVTSCAIDTRKTLLQNVSLYGGSSGFNGIVERLESELTSLAGGAECRVRRPDLHLLLAWQGCVTLMDQSDACNLFICKNDAAAVWCDHPEKTQETYEELGPSTIHRLIPRQF